MSGIEDNLGDCHGGGKSQSYKPIKTTIKTVAFIWSGFIFLGFFALLAMYLTDPPARYAENPESQAGCCASGEQTKTTPSFGEGVNAERQNTRKQRAEQLAQVQRTDLAAQRGMWRATNAVAFIAFGQLIATLIGLYWVYRTLKATGLALGHTEETLSQARIATRQARESTENSVRVLEQQNIANQIELQPYLTFEFVECWKYSMSSFKVNAVEASELTDFQPRDPTQPPNTINTKDSRGIEVHIKITNEGKSPASNIFIDCDGGASMITYCSEQYGRESFQSATPRPYDTRDHIIPAGRHMIAKLKFPEKTVFMESGHENRFFNSPQGRFELECILVKDIKIRFKDFTCTETTFHKLITGSVTYSKHLEDAGLTAKSASISWQTHCDDSTNKHYSQLVK